MSRAFGLTGRTKIFRRDATSLGEAGTVAPFGLVFADPPYGKGLGERALRSASGRRLAARPARSAWSRRRRPRRFEPGPDLRCSTSAAMANGDPIYRRRLIAFRRPHPRPCCRPHDEQFTYRGWRPCLVAACDSDRRSH